MNFAFQSESLQLYGVQSCFQRGLVLYTPKFIPPTSAKLPQGLGRMVMYGKQVATGCDVFCPCAGQSNPNTIEDQRSVG